MRTSTRTTGQAIVEFALTATLIFFLLVAAVDLGLIYFDLQGLHNAAQEGGTYGSRPISANDAVTLDYNGIRDRVRHEAGDQGIGFANLLDLNTNGIPDVGPSNTTRVGDPGATYEMVNGQRVIDQYITIETLFDSNGDGEVPDDLFPQDGAPDVCTNLSASVVGCYIRVTVSTDHRLVFPLAPAFADQFRLRSSFVMPMRSSFSQTGDASPNTPVVVTMTPTPTPTPSPMSVSVVRSAKMALTGNRSNIYIVVQVTSNGAPVADASVSTPLGALTYRGNGTYAICAVQVNNAGASTSVTASRAGSNNATATANLPTVTTPPACP